MSSAPEPKQDDGDRRRGGAFYDEPHVFERYQLHREWSMNPNLVMEEPAVLAELGKLSGQRILDLGCGDAAIARVLLHGGATRYLGVDGSQRMVSAASASLSDTIAEIEHCDIEAFASSPGSFDLVISRMALHYIANVEPILRECHRWLSPGGRIIFTVVHPIITSHDARSNTDQPRQDWVVDDYFHSGPRDQTWLGAKSRWYHRTIEQYVRHLHDAGFALANLRECPPVRERFDDDAEYERRRRVPLVLLFTGSRAG
jgi:SAM-dependent methyltransferase